MRFPVKGTKADFVPTNPAARQFRESILQYMASEQFQPADELNVEWVRGLYEK